jgi:CxxC motif-containing protein
MLSEEAKEARREYHRQWNKNNRDKVNTYQKNWRCANPEKKKRLEEKYWERKANLMTSIRSGDIISTKLLNDGIPLPLQKEMYNNE